jgi:nicotinate dehydrogenase subunit B
MNRRNFLKNTGCLAIGFSLQRSFIDLPSPMFQELPESIKRHPNINAWLEVLANGQVRIFTGKLELGQGIGTAIAQVAAEELDLDMNKVEVVLADTLRTPNEGYTVGSGSIEQSAMAVCSRSCQA